MTWEDFLGYLRNNMKYSGDPSLAAVIAWLGSNFGTVEIEVPVEVAVVPEEVLVVASPTGEALPVIVLSGAGIEQKAANVPVATVIKLAQHLHKLHTSGSLVGAQQTKALLDRIAVLENDQKLGVNKPVEKTFRHDVKVLGDRVEDDPKYGFKNDREFLEAVLLAGKQGQPDRMFQKYPGLKMLYVTSEKAVGSDEQSGFADPFGAFLVPETFSPDLLKLEPEEDTIGGRTLKIPMETPIVKINARTDKSHSTSVSGGLTVSRRGESLAITSSRMEFEQVELKASMLAGLSYVTEELLQDSPRSVAAILAEGFQDEFTSVLIDERLNGTGAGEFMGIMNSPCLVTISKEDGQAANTILYENVVKMRARCWHYADAVWHANHDCFPQLSQISLGVGTGGSVMYQTSLREDRPDLLMGRPIFYTEYTKTIGTTGDLVLGNWSQYLEGTYQPMQSAESIHVRFVNHERTFKFWTRNDGAPWWRSALTPKNGSTLSPFVVLATRA